MSNVIRHIDEAPAPLAGGATFNGRTLDAESIPGGFSGVRALAFADQAGTINIQESRDGQSWRTTYSTALTANVAATTPDHEITARYARVQLVNGATPQTALELETALVTEV